MRATDDLSGIISDPGEIEKKSFEIIGSLVERGGYSEEEFEVVKRVVHATADIEFAGLMLFSKGAVAAGMQAVGTGCDIVTDVRMLQAGISAGRPGGGSTHCFISDPDVASDAKRAGTTRAAAAMRKAAPLMGGAIVAVGNAPTALYELIEMIEAGTARPALVIGVPVGFVGAAESKERLVERVGTIPYISCRGRKGGSPVAAAVVNAITRLSASRQT